MRSALHVDFAREMGHFNYLLPTPDVNDSEAGPDFTIATLDALAQMKLTPFGLTEIVHL